MRFANPYMLWLLAIVPLLAWLMFRVPLRRSGTLRYSDITHLKHAPRSLATRARALIPALRLAALTLVIVALARPQFGWKISDDTALGIDIIQALDVSDSMHTTDIDPYRLAAAKQEVVNFIEGRRNDRIGCVVFGAQSFILCPLTLDYDVLKQFIDDVNFNIVDGRRTAIGMGLANSVRLLEESEAKSKVIILLTDGVNNSGQIDPFTAAEMAKALGIRVYTIGVGAPPDMRALLDRVGQVEFDEDTLRKIADITDGQFFHATDRRKLEEIYKEIDRMEKTKIETTEYEFFDERMEWAVAPALLVLLVEILLGYTRFRKLP
jgi:Ca-activated chloride channel family protein